MIQISYMSTPLSSPFTTKRIDRFGLFFLIIAIHFLLLRTFTPQSNKDNLIKQSSVQLIFITQQTKKLSNVSSIKSQESSTYTKIKKPTSMQNPAKNNIEETSINEGKIMGELSTNIPKTSSPLNIDVKTITKEMKKEFERGEKSNYKSKYKTFSATIASTYVAKQNGVQVEQVHAFDGRPISKVTTPYGTYCLRHYKPGEKLEMTPPSYAMTCDNY